MPHNPTPPEARNPPSSICPVVGITRMSTSWVSRNGWKRRVRAKTTSEPSDTAK